MDRENVELIRGSEYDRSQKLPFVTFRNDKIKDRHRSRVEGKDIYRNVVIADVCAAGETKCIVPKEVRSWKIEERKRKVNKEVTELIAVQVENEHTGEVEFEERPSTTRKTVEEPEFVYIETWPWFEQLEEMAQKQKDPLESQRYRLFRDAIRKKYDAWQESGEIPLDGTPLDTCPISKPEIKERFIELGINTVERLAEATEDVIVQIMGGRDAVSQAQKFLATYTDKNQSAQLVKDMEAKLEAQSLEMERQKSEFEAVKAKLEAMVVKQANTEANQAAEANQEQSEPEPDKQEAAPKKQRGRPKKVA